MNFKLIGNSKQSLPQDFNPENSFLIAADGGYQKIRALGLQPHLVIGDLDSLTESEIAEAARTGLVYKFPRLKTFSDLELGFFYAERNHAQKIDVHCWSDERIDYSLYTLRFFKEARSKIHLHGDNFEIQILNSSNPRVQISLPPNLKLSLFPLQSGSRISSQNLRWELLDYQGFSLSNEVASGDPVQLKVGAGSWAFLWEKASKASF